MSCIAGPNAPESGIVFQLDAANIKSYPGSGTVWRNLVGTNNGNLQNSPTFNNTHFSFNAASSQQVTTDVSFSSGSVNATQFTQLIWFRTSTASGRKLLGFGNQQSIAETGYDKQFYISTGGALLYGIYTGVVNTYTVDSNVTNNQWKMAAAVYNVSGNTDLYLNGNFVVRAPLISSDSYTPTWIRIAGGTLTAWPNANSGLGYFTGDISIVKIYNRNLSAAEIQQEFEANRGRFGI